MLLAFVCVCVCLGVSNVTTTETENVASLSSSSSSLNCSISLLLYVYMLYDTHLLNLPVVRRLYVRNILENYFHLDGGNRLCLCVSVSASIWMVVEKRYTAEKWSGAFLQQKRYNGKCICNLYVILQLFTFYTCIRVYIKYNILSCNIMRCMYVQ